MTGAANLAGLVAGKDARRFINQWSARPDRWWHRSSAGLGCLLTAQVLGWTLGRQVLALTVGAAFGGGKWSPDGDQSKFWRWLDRVLPDEALGKGGPLQHHGILHSPWLALAGVWAAITFAPAWPLWLVPCAWFWHDLGDVAIGKGGANVRAGVPWVGWWGWWGLGIFKSGGATGRGLTVVCWAGIAWRLWAGVTS